MKDKRNILIGIGIGAIVAALLLIVFFFGMFVGKRDSRFFPYWERRHTYPDFFPKRFDGHGVLGEIQTLGENTLVVKDRTGALKTVIVDDQTMIRRGHTVINFSDLKENEQIIVLGEPEEKEAAIKAKLIRTMGGFNKEATGSSMMRLK